MAAEGGSRFQNLAPLTRKPAKRAATRRWRWRAARGSRGWCCRRAGQKGVQPREDGGGGRLESRELGSRCCAGPAACPRAHLGFGHIVASPNLYRNRPGCPAVDRLVRVGVQPAGVCNPSRVGVRVVRVCPGYPGRSNGQRGFVTRLGWPRGPRSARPNGAHMPRCVREPLERGAPPEVVSQIAAQTTANVFTSPAGNTVGSSVESLAECGGASQR